MVAAPWQVVANLLTTQLATMSHEVANQLHENMVATVSKAIYLQYYWYESLLVKSQANKTIDVQHRCSHFSSLIEAFNYTAPLSTVYHEYFINNILSY